MSAVGSKIGAIVVLTFLIMTGLWYAEGITVRQFQLNERDAAIATVNGGDTAVLNQMASKNNVKAVSVGFKIVEASVLAFAALGIVAVATKKEKKNEAK